MYCLGLGGGAAKVRDRLLSSLWQPLILKKIIGRRRRSRDLHLVCRGLLYFRLMLPLFHEQARQHRIRALLNITIHQMPDFLSDIRRVVQPGQFVGLQGIARSTKKNIPRRRGLVLAIQGGLQGNTF
jgi:hypothetical protein